MAGSVISLSLLVRGGHACLQPPQPQTRAEPEAACALCGAYGRSLVSPYIVSADIQMLMLSGQGGKPGLELLKTPT